MHPDRAADFDPGLSLSRARAQAGSGLKTIQNYAKPFEELVGERNLPWKAM